MVQSERNASRLHPKIIATELQRATLGMDMSENEVKQHDLSELELLKALEERVFEIMNAAVLNVRMTKMPLYSNFHSYEHLRKIKSKVEAADAANAIAAEIAPYGSCLFMANECYKAFKADLLAEKGPEYAEFARRVEYATESWDQNPKSSREMHCVAMLRLWDHCIVFDPVSCGYAIKVPVGQVTKKLAAEYQFCYAAVNEYNCYLVRYPPNGGEIRNLLAHPILKHNFSYSGPYMSIKGGFEGAVANLAWPTASYIGRLPSRRFVQIQQTWERQPSYPEFSHFALPDAFVHFDFQKRQIECNSIPYEHWLARKENAHLLRRLQFRRGLFVGIGRANFHQKLISKGTKYNQVDIESLQLLAELCEALGLPKGELMRLAYVMMEVWQQHGLPKQDAKRKNGGKL